MRRVSGVAPSTPTKKGAGLTDDQGSPSFASTKSPRRQHKCAHCQRPRQGHPRSGCPYVEPPIPPSTPTSRAPTVIEIVGDLEQLSLVKKLPTDQVSNAKAEDDKERRRRRSSVTPRKIERDPSLASVSTTTSEMLQKLGQPGAMASLTDDETEKEDAKSSTRRPARKSEIQSPSRAKPLRRTPTDEDISGFLTDLENKSKVEPACGFLLSAEDLAALRPRFTQVKGLVVRVLTSDKDPDAYVVVGKDAEAVDGLIERVRADAKKGGSVRRSVLSAGTIGVAAAGAFAMYASLAYV